MKKKIYKALSVVLALMIVFSACLCAISTVSAADKTYFVSSTGKETNNGLTQRTAVKTVGKAVELAIAAGCTTGDTVTIKVLNTTAVSWLESGNRYVPDYDFQLVVTSQAASGNAIIGDGSTVNMGGDVEFNNIKVNFGSNWTNFCAKGYNLTFGTGVELMGSAAQTGFNVGAYDGSTMNTYNEPITVVNNLPIKYFGLVANYSGCTFNEDVNVVYSAGEAPIFYVSSDSSTTINKALNVVIKSATGVSFSLKTIGDKTGSVTFGDEGYMQVLNASPAQLTEESFPEGVDTTKLWVLNNKLRAADLVELTDTKGKFKVNTEVYQNIKATSVSDSETVINEEDGYLILPAGVYNITAEKIPQIGTYYVKKNGTGNGSSPESPLGDIATALATAVNDGYIVGDIVKVMIVGDTIEMGTVPSYAFNLEIDSNDPAIQPRIVTSGAIANNASGLTTFGNVELYREKEWAAMNLQSSNVIFSEKSKYTVGYGTSVVFGTNNGGTAKEEIAGQKVVYAASGAPYAIYLSNWNWANRIYTDVVDFEYNVPGGSSQIFLNAAYGGATNGNTTYKKALNINVKNATLLTFSNLDDLTFEEGLQIINSGVNAMDPAEGELSKIPEDKLYLINNISGNNNIIEFTDTVGKYKVNLDNPEHELVAKNLTTNDEIKYDGTSGFIKLEAGVYELRIDRDPVYNYYYVDSANGVEVVAGTRPEDVGTKANPVKTYADATRLIAQDGLADIDVATVIIPSGGETTWGTEPATFSCQLIITSSMEGDPGTLRHSPTKGVSLTGNTTLRNMNLVLDYQWGGISLGGYNFTVEKDASADVNYTRIWNTGYGVKHTKDQTITIKGEFITNSIELGAEYHNHTCTGDINIFYDSPSSAATIALGGGTYATEPNIYEGNINITIMNAAAFALATRITGADIQGSLQILVDDSVKLPYSVKTNFDNFEAAGGKWYITNAASDDEFVGFTANKGVYSFKGDTAYSRQFGADQVTHTGGIFDLSTASGSYTVSDKDIAPLTDESHKALYFRLAGGGHNLSTRAKVTPGETYRFEYSIFNSMYADTKPAIRDDGDRGVTCPVTIISEEKIGDYYRVVAEGTIPEDYSHGSTACFGVNLPSYSEGLIFDRTVYNVSDPDKKNCFEGNPIFHDGLDFVTLDQAKFWGRIIHSSGQVAWTNGFEQLEVINFSEEYIAYLISLNNPNDGEWWNPEDVIEEEIYVGHANVKGTFKDHEGNPVAGVELLLESDENSYTVTTNEKGEFEFKDIVVGFYTLYIVNGEENIFTGFTSYVAEDDLVTFNIVTDTSNVTPDSDIIIDSQPGQPSPDQSVQPDQDQPGQNDNQEVVDGATFKGVFTDPNGNPVAGVQLLLVSGDNKYTVTTNENGEFEFTGLIEGDYELYLINGDENIFTGFSSHIGSSDVVKFDMSADVSILFEDPNIGVDDNEAVQPDDGIVEEQQPNDEIVEEQPNDQIVDVQPNDQIVEVQPNDQIVDEQPNDQNFDQNVDSNIGYVPNDGVVNQPTDFDTVVDGEIVDEIVPSGNLSGTVYTPYRQVVPGLKLYLRNVMEFTTDQNGYFAIADIPVGQYDIYTLLEDGSEYVLANITIVENSTSQVVLKYAPPVETEGEQDNGWIVWVIIASVVALLVVAGLIFFLVIRKKKIEQV